MEEKKTYDIEDAFRELDEFAAETEKKDRFRKVYSKFENFPANVKKNLFINLIIILSVFILCMICIFKLKYITPLLIAVTLAIIFFLGIKSIMTIRYLKYADFVTFTGKIVESYPVGSKLTNNFHYIVKLQNDEGKELCFRYFDKQTLMYDQSLTLFIRENSEIVSSNYGSLIENYIEVVPTDDIESRFILEDIKDDNNGETVSVKDYLEK